MAKKAVKQDIPPEAIAMVDPWYWAFYYKLKLSRSRFTLKGHEYQVGVLQDDTPRKVARKGAQLGFTDIAVILTLHGMIYERYPAGAMYLFPTGDDVGDFAKSRFNPLIEKNPISIGRYVQNTNSTHIKQIGNGFLYLRGARLSSKAGGKFEQKSDSSKLRSVSVDLLVLDERDLMTDEAIDLAMQRMSHSEVKHYISFSTPTVPDWGIDKEYQESDQRVWMIKCRHCGAYTCLEMEFPNCLQEQSDGKVIRVCKKCKREIYPKDGEWVKSYENSDTAGWWISQLNSIYVDPKKILDAYRDPPHGNLAEVYNSMLGLPYVPSENVLKPNDVLARCTNDLMAYSSPGPCGMGVDVGSVLHVVVGDRPNENTVRILYCARVSDFNELHDIAKRFNVGCAVIDIQPETRQAREFQKSESYPVYLCDYIHTLHRETVWDEKEFVVKVNRTEICDASHELVVSPGKLMLPRRSEELDEYVKQMCSLVKVLQEDSLGNRTYVYRKRGPDHYRHATNYLMLALQRVGLAREGGASAVPRIRLHNRILSWMMR